MSSLLAAALADPWAALDRVLDGPLHPGGTDATAALLDRAGVTAGTRLLDVGCGAGDALAVARGRGARAVGLDVNPGGAGTVRGDVVRLPVRDDGVDVVLAECVLCLSEDVPRSLAEARRVLDRGGRLAVSDVVVEGELPDLPEAITGLCCLDGRRRRADLLARLDDAGFAVVDLRDHPDDLLAMRDRVAERVDYERLLGALGERGERLRDGIAALETAVEDGRVNYVSLVATPDG